MAVFRRQYPTLNNLPDLREIGCFDIQRADRYPFPPHVHPWLEICYVARGRVEWWVGDDEDSEIVMGGNAYVTQPGEFHGSVQGQLSPCRVYWLQFDVSNAAPLGLPAAEGRALSEALTSLPRRFFAMPPTLADEYDRILDNLERPEAPLLVAEIRAELLRLVIDVVRAAQDGGEGDVSSMCRAAIEIMHEHMETPLGLNEMAARLGWSVSHFKHRFRTEMGVSPSDYYLRLRLDGARQRLISSDHTITAIAQDFGFSSSQNFATIFKRMIGVTPSQIRAQQARRPDAAGSGARPDPER
jgi:AraC-like DNA-binding protein